jgi:hypothetical protein
LVRGLLAQMGQQFLEAFRKCRVGVGLQGLEGGLFV